MSQGIIAKAAIMADYMREKVGNTMGYHSFNNGASLEHQRRNEEEAWQRADQMRAEKGYPLDNCPTCGRPYHKGPIAKFCGRNECKNKRAKEAIKARKGQKFKGFGFAECEVCHVRFEKKTPRQKTCGYKCRYTLANNNARARAKKMYQIEAKEKNRKPVILNENKPIFIEERIPFNSPQCTPLENWWATSSEQCDDRLYQESIPQGILLENSQQLQASL